MKVVKNKARQGDVLLRRKKIDLSDAKLLTKGDKDTRVVMAYGEVTGHAHAFYNSDVELVEKDGLNFVKISKESDLQHEEHSTIRFAPGDWEKVQQVEWKDEPLRVAD